MQRSIFQLFFLLIYSFSCSVYGQFGGRNEISKSVQWPLQSKLYDLDQDGDLDILSCSNWDSKVSWYENLGSGGFSTLKLISNQYFKYCDVLASDLDNDGDLDIAAVAIADNKVVWFENFGQGVFSADIVIGETLEPNHLAVADVELDGDLDVFCSSYQGHKVVWFENLGSGDFGDVQTATSGLYHILSVDLADLDGDGLKDIIAAEFDGTDRICWAKNLGTGYFGPQQTIDNDGEIPLSTLGEDVDLDGDIDIVTASFGGEYFRWYKNDGTGNFNVQPAVAYLSGPKVLKSMDLNYDGFKDLIYCGGNSSGYYLRIKYNDGNNNFINSTLISSSMQGPISIDFGDINNDGFVDILVGARFGNEIHWFENDGQGLNFIGHEIGHPINIINSLDYGDFDNNGFKDIIINSKNAGTVLMYKNFGMNEFSEAIQIYTNMQEPTYVKSIDFNGDGILDIVSAADGSDEIFYHQNDGFGNFTTSIIYSANDFDGTVIHIVDFDDDGDADLFTTNDSDQVIYLENIGNATFAPEIIVPSTISFHTYDLKSGDLDGDLDEDLIISAYTLGKILWIENLGNGTFGAEYEVANSISGVYKVLPEDFDMDGDNDIVAVSYNDGTLFWYENLGAGNFSSQNIIQNNLEWPQSLTTKDFDSDGDMDILFAGDTVKVILFENNSDGTFSFGQLISDMSYRIYDTKAVDIDNDGDFEVVTGGENNVVAWHENMLKSFYHLSGNVFYDENEDGVFNFSDFGVSNFNVGVNPYTSAYYSDNNGHYYFSVQEGFHSVNIGLSNFWHLTSDSISYNKNINFTNSFYDDLNFGIHEDTLINGLEIDLQGTIALCNSIKQYKVFTINNGTTFPSGYYHLQLDDSLTLVSTNFAPDSIVNQNIYWSFDSTQIGSYSIFSIDLQMPDFMSLGDLITSYVDIYILNENDSLVLQNSDVLSQILVCSYDPNDKSVSPIGISYQHFIQSGDELEYLIRFQNTGNYLATNVMLRDQLDHNLDLSSFEMISTSHPANYWIEPDGELVVYYENIMLPDSNSNEIESHGFFKYKIKTKSNLDANELIVNNAEIYFDQNPAILTNTVFNTIYDCENAYVLLNTNLICYDDTLYAQAFYEPFNNYTWESNSSIIGNSENLIWVPDSSGDYSITLFVENELCIKDTTFQTQVLPQIDVTNVIDTICHIDSVFFDGYYIDQPGIYFQVLNSINGCDSVIELQLVKRDFFDVSIESFYSDTICSNAIISLPLGAPLGGVYLGSGVIGNNFDASMTGNGNQYVVYEFIDEDNCINRDTAIIFVDPCLSIIELEDDLLQIYPNPASDVVFINSNDKSDGQILITSIDGKNIFVNEIIKDGNCKIELSHLSSGIYLLQYNSKNTHSLLLIKI